MRALLVSAALGWLACGDASAPEPGQVPERSITDCEQALLNLREWAGLADASSMVQESLVSVCEEGTSMATNGRLDCLLETDVASAALCVSRLERETLSETCDSESDLGDREACLALLGEPSTLVLEARQRALTSGDWLQLWSCQASDIEGSRPTLEEVRSCGLQVLEQIFMVDCRAGRFSTDACQVRWALQRPREEDWLAARLESSAE